MDESEDRKKTPIAQPKDVMFERNLAIMTSKGREIEVNVPGTKYEGYASGLDEKYLQLCLTDGLSLVLINRDQIISLVETGKTLEQDSDLGKRIRERVGTFMHITSQHQSKKN